MSGKDIVNSIQNGDFNEADNIISSELSKKSISHVDDIQLEVHKNCFSEKEEE